ncbi:MAG TPA: Mu-like prophage major head subunit gpT family protein [Kofleriaceae bacterium]|nr:Mu-like prophage major head subunit gpT family protein [Kofleriaceae bacterium]
MKRLREVLAKLGGNPTELRKHAPQLFRAAVGSVAALRAAGGGAITPELRDEMLAKCMAGAHVELEVDLLAYEQQTGARNRNSVRFRDGGMMTLGRSGKGTPFLRDHAQSDSLAKGGTITASSTEKRAEGDYCVRQTMTLTAPWAVEMALRGLLGSVSIGWNPTGPVMCSACNAPIFSRCWHCPGDRLAEADAEGGGKRKVRQADGPIVVEWIYTEAELVETSAVNVPGVPSARIEDIRASMAASLAASNPDLRAELASGGDFLRGDLVPEENEMDPELLKLLGLSSTATPGEVLAAVNKRVNDAATDKATLAIVQGELAAFKTQLAGLQADLNQRAEETFIAGALASGRITKGDEKHWRTLHQLDAKRAGELMAERAEGSATPVGQPPQRGTDPAPGPIPAPERSSIILAGGERASVRRELAKLARKLQGDPRAAALAVHMFGFQDLGGKLAGSPDDLRTVLGATGIINNADLDAARVGFHAAFLERLETEPDDDLAMMFTEVPSNKKIEEWDWMGDLPDFEEWTADRKLAMLEGFKLRVLNKKWSNGLRIKNDDIKDDALGLIGPQIGDLASRARSHRFDLMVKLLLNGFDGNAYPEVGNGLGYDGAFFFSDSGHRGGNDNKMTLALDSAGLVQAQLQLRRMKTYDGRLPFRVKGTHLLVGPKLEFTAEKLLTQEYLANGESNPHRNKYKLLVSDRIDGDFDDYWFLLCLSRQIRPFLFQRREEISTSAVMGNQGGNNDSVPRFMNDELWFGAEARYNVAYFEHRLAVGSQV